MKKKKLTFLENWTKNVNDITLNVQKVAIDHQMKQAGLEEKPKNRLKSIIKMVFCYGFAILIGVMFGFFYGLMGLCLLMFLYNMIEMKFD